MTKKHPQEVKKVNPIEVFQVIGASDDINSTTLEQTAKAEDVSPEVIDFFETLPPNITEPSEIVEAAADAGSNEAGVELELPDENQIKPELTIEDVTQGTSPDA